MNAAKASKMSEVTFRAATRTDEGVLLRMMRNLAEQEPGPYFFDEPVVAAALGKFLADANLGEAWIFLDGETPAGYAILTFGFSFEFHGRDAFLDELYVEPNYRGQGIGRRAVEFIEKRARACGVNAIHLEVDEGNTAAEELYRRTGYADHSRYLMTKWLREE
jgi:GNAT superfamily N-acetyltransferase